MQRYRLGKGSPWCALRDLNPHVLTELEILSLVRLPFRQARTGNGVSISWPINEHHSARAIFQLFYALAVRPGHIGPQEPRNLARD